MLLKTQHAINKITVSSSLSPDVSILDKSSLRQKGLNFKGYVVVVVVLLLNSYGHVGMVS